MCKKYIYLNTFSANEQIMARAENIIQEIYQFPISLLEKTHEIDFHNYYETVSWAVIDKLNLSDQMEYYAKQFYIEAIKNKPIYQTNINRDLLQLGNEIRFLPPLNFSYNSCLHINNFIKIIINRKNKCHLLCKKI